MGIDHFKPPHRMSKQHRPQRTRSQPVNAAFDLWLKRGMHQLYDHVAFEPVPEDLLKLIQEGKGNE